MKYPKIKPKIKSGKEFFKFKNKKTKYKLIDFWKWSYSNILSNATRGVLSEFIVASAVNVNIKTPREEWAPYDLITQEGIKIEVKSASYIQAWEQKNFSKISFSIKESNICKTEDLYKNNTGKTRAADVYVMCLLHHTEQKTIDPTNLDQWKFYVLSVKEINDYKRSQFSITLKSLEKLTEPVSYSELNEAIKNAFLKNHPLQFLTHSF